MAQQILFQGPDQDFQFVESNIPTLLEGELLVRVLCCTICKSDLHTHAGRRQEPTPCVLGHEIVGRIAAFGPNTSTQDARGRMAAVGDRITWPIVVGCGACFYCAQDLPQKCTNLYKYGHIQANPERPMGGGLAEYVILVPRTCWLKVPEAIPDQVAASANCATATCAAVVRSVGSVQGKHVLILGAGMLGLTICAMCRSAGARSVFVADPLPSNRERAWTFGATEVFDSEENELRQAVLDRTEQRGVDVVLEMAGSPQAVQMALTLGRIGSMVILVGSVLPTKPISLDPEQIVRRWLTIRGVHNYHPDDLITAIDFLAGPGQAFPFAKLIAQTFSLNETQTAFTYAHTHPGLRVAVVTEKEGARKS